jgi:hypothetical protein
MREVPELGDPRSSIGVQNVINNDCWIIILSMLFAFFHFVLFLFIDNRGSRCQLDFIFVLKPIFSF